MDEDKKVTILETNCPACNEIVKFDLKDRTVGDFVECEECFTSLEIKSLPEFFAVTNLGK